MIRIENFYSLALASVLVAFLVVPSLAENPPGISMPSQTAPAESYGAPASSQHPTYIWQGNRGDSEGMSSLGSPGLPQAVQAGGIRYITGGIGDEERDALDAVKNQYNLHVTSTNNIGEFNGDTQITILDRTGANLVSTTAGPLFYADLPAGTYTVEASTAGQVKTQKVTVGQSKSSSLYFRW